MIDYINGALQLDSNPFRAITLDVELFNVIG
jgi:hypothetical protein